MLYSNQMNNIFYCKGEIICLSLKMLIFLKPPFDLRFVIHSKNGYAIDVFDVTEDISDGNEDALAFEIAAKKPLFPWYNDDL